MQTAGRSRHTPCGHIRKWYSRDLVTLSPARFPVSYSGIHIVKSQFARIRFSHLHPATRDSSKPGAQANFRARIMSHVVVVIKRPNLISILLIIKRLMSFHDVKVRAPGDLQQLSLSESAGTYGLLGLTSINWGGPQTPDSDMKWKLYHDLIPTRFSLLRLAKKHIHTCIYLYA
jgi:hypothetical protein